MLLSVSRTASPSASCVPLSYNSSPDHEPDHTSMRGFPAGTGHRYAHILSLDKLLAIAGAEASCFRIGSAATIRII